MNKKNITKIITYVYIFNIIITTYLAYYYFSPSDRRTIQAINLLIGISLFPYYFFKMKLVEKILFSTLIAQGILINSYGWIELIVLIIIGKYNERKKILKFSMILNILFFLTIILLYYLDLLNNFNKVGTHHILSAERLSLGFNHYNIPNIYFWGIVTSYIYIKEKKILFIEKIIIIICSYILYINTHSRQGLYFIIILLIIETIFNKNFIQKIIDKLKYIFMFIPIVIGTLAIYLSKNYKNYNQLNNLLSRRLYFTAKYLENNYYSYFGKKITEETIRKYPVDNLYIYYFIERGIIIYIFFLIGISYLVLKMIENKKYKILTIAIGYLLYFNFEKVIDHRIVGINLIFIWNCFEKSKSKFQ